MWYSETPINGHFDTTDTSQQWNGQIFLSQNAFKELLKNGHFYTMDNYTCPNGVCFYVGSIVFSFGAVDLCHIDSHCLHLTTDGHTCSVNGFENQCMVISLVHRQVRQ